MVNISYLSFMLDNLGYRFEDRLTLTGVTKDVLHGLYENNPQDLKLLSTGKHSRFRRIRKEDWIRIKHRGTEIMVCVRKYASRRGVISIIDRSSDEIKKETRRTYLVLEENDKI